MDLFLYILGISWLTRGKNQASDYLGRLDHNRVGPVVWLGVSNNHVLLFGWTTNLWGLSVTLTQGGMCPLTLEGSWEHACSLFGWTTILWGLPCHRAGCDPLHRVRVLVSISATFTMTITSTPTSLTFHRFVLFLSDIIVLLCH